MIILQPLVNINEDFSLYNAKRELFDTLVGICNLSGHLRYLFLKLGNATKSALKYNNKTICVLRQSGDNNNLDPHLDNYYPHLAFVCIRIIMGIRWRHTKKKTKLI